MKFFPLQELRYKLILYVSILLFFISYLSDILFVPSETELSFVLGYTLAILIAALWSILNYIDHLRINPLYKQYTSTEEFVKDLSLPKDEKMEIQLMMDDYVRDQIQKGVPETEAAEQIIRQFKTSELQETTSVFYLHDHTYLLKFGTASLLFGIIVFLSKALFPALESIFLVVLEITALCYGVGFYLSFVMYRLLNRILIRK